VVPYNSVYGHISAMRNTSVLIYVASLLVGVIAVVWTSRVCTRSLYSAARGSPENQGLGGHCLQEFNILVKLAKRASGPINSPKMRRTGDELESDDDDDANIVEIPYEPQVVLTSNDKAS